MPDSPPVHRLDEAEARFLIKRALQKLSASTLNDLKAAPAKRELAQAVAVDQILAHLTQGGHSIWRGPGVRGH